MSALVVALNILSCLFAPAPQLENHRFAISVHEDHSWTVTEKETKKQWLFRPDFVVLTAPQDPGMAMRPAGIENVMYNAVTWKANTLPQEDLIRTEAVRGDVAGDGFDDRILKGNTSARTADVFKSGKLVRLSALTHSTNGGQIEFAFDNHDAFELKATLSFADPEAFPSLRYTFHTRKESFYSVGYVGAPSYALADVSELWQPMVWQEKRMPEKSFLTLAFQCPLPTTLVCSSGQCSGVVADPSEFPFEPLPLLDNSRFGVALRTEDGRARPTLFAPALGGAGSHMKAGNTFNFQMRLYLGTGDITGAYEEIARSIYQFKDFRRNANSTLNKTVDNMMEYGMSDYSAFIDSLKGCAYSTDVPGAVKNVSSLNPLQMALLTDREDIYWKRAYPIMEFLISREKFLFTLDSTQKIQNPSRKMRGPVAPVSELTALYEISGGKSKALLELAQGEYNNSRTRNLDVKEPGDTWQNALALYRATDDRAYLDKAVRGADEYIKRRVEKPAGDFQTIEGGFFFWTGFTPDWINLLTLFEVTQDKKYLRAAQEGARHYAMFCWFAPVVPDELVHVNDGNKAPLYWYLKSKGHLQMSVPEEQVPAWRLSEIGLTPESSGTCAGHRAIFMANFAPWMMRIGTLADDPFLVEIARSAVIGRYENFPGYHINTARTTAYEKADYPLRPFKELSVNSFHFNHIWPHMSILVDYLFTDAFMKSQGKVVLPSSFIEGYAYLQSKFYGHEPGEFYGDKNVYAWMPPALLETTSPQLNYVAFRGNNNTYVAFLNQSPEPVKAKVTLNHTYFPAMSRGGYTSRLWRDNEEATVSPDVANGQFDIEVSPGSITAICIQGLHPEVKFQDKLFGRNAHSNSKLVQLKAGEARAMILDFGKDLRTLYLYLQEDDNKVREASLEYRLNGKKQVIKDSTYPFEFTVRMEEKKSYSKFVLRVTGKEGVVSEKVLLTKE